MGFVIASLCFGYTTDSFTTRLIQTDSRSICVWFGDSIGGKQAYRSGLRVCDLYNDEVFETRMRNLFAEAKDQFGDKFKADVESEISRYRELAQRVKPFVTDTVKYLNDAHTQVRARVCFREWPKHAEMPTSNAEHVEQGIGPVS